MFGIARSNQSRARAWRAVAFNLVSILALIGLSMHGLASAQEMLEDEQSQHSDAIRVQWPTESVQQATYAEGQPARIVAPSARQIDYVPLRPRSDAQKTGPASMTGLVTMLGSLAIVLGLFFLIAWLLRRGLPVSSHSLPNEVVQVLGRTTLEGRQHLRLIRFGNKLLLTCVSPGRMETLAEITDPREIDRLSLLCHAASGTATQPAVESIVAQRDQSKFRSHLDRPGTTDRTRALLLTEAADG